MNKKQFYVTSILVFLMGVMVVMQQFFNIQNVALVNNNIEDMLDYSALDGNITYKLPDNWRSEVTAPGDYIVYNNNFVGEELGIVGSVKVISSKTGIDELINIDKKTFDAEKVNNIKVHDEMINESNVKKLVYEEVTDNGRHYLTKVYYFLLGDNLKLKVTFSAGLDKYKESYETIYRLILESIKKAK